MQAKNSWGFTSLLRDVNITRILREAGPHAKVVRFKIDNKTYTAVNMEWMQRHGYEIAWDDEPPAYLDETDTACAGRVNGKVAIQARRDEGKWAICYGDLVARALGAVKVKVDVF